MKKSKTPSKKKRQSKNRQGLMNHVWRFMTLGQILAIFCILVYAIIGYASTYIYVDVPIPPLAGSANWKDELQNADYINRAEGWVNLVSTYHHLNAAPQFEKAKSMILGDYAEKFHAEMMAIELTAIRQTSRSSIVLFDSDPYVEIIPDEENYRAQLRFSGQGQKQIEDKIYSVRVQWDLELGFGEITANNPYGLYITNAERTETKS